MTAKHHTTEYRRNARIIRERAKASHRAGRPVLCWRCRRPIPPHTPFDVGHLPGARASALHELAPEHRSRTESCPGNRAHGGAIGAAKTNARHAPKIAARNITTWNI